MTMQRLVFTHADKDLIFTVSPVHWDDQATFDALNRIPELPPSGKEDAGKFLVVDTDGVPRYMSVKPGAVDFNVVTYTITGNKGSVQANLNANDTPLVVHPSQLVFIYDTESASTYVWVGGIGSFGASSGATTIYEAMLTEIKAGDIDLTFATSAEVAAGQENAKALSPFNVDFLDVDGGKF